MLKSEQPCLLFIIGLVAKSDHLGLLNTLRYYSCGSKEESRE